MTYTLINTKSEISLIFSGIHSTWMVTYKNENHLQFKLSLLQDILNKLSYTKKIDDEMLDMAINPKYKISTTEMRKK